MKNFSCLYFFLASNFFYILNREKSWFRLETVTCMYMWNVCPFFFFSKIKCIHVLFRLAETKTIHFINVQKLLLLTGTCPMRSKTKTIHQIHVKCTSSITFIFSFILNINFISCNLKQISSLIFYELKSILTEFMDFC